MKSHHRLLLPSLGIILVLVGLALTKYLKWFILLPVGIGLVAIFKGLFSKKKEIEDRFTKDKGRGKTKKEDEEESDDEPGEDQEEGGNDDEDEKEDEPEEETDDEQEILGMKLKPGAHTTLLKKIEPSIDTLKPMIFWPFVSKNQPKEEEQKKSKEFKYCKECGVKIPKTSKFCSECGK